MKRIFRLYSLHILLTLIILLLIITITSFMLWGIGEWEKQWLMQCFIVSGILTVLASIIYGQIK